MKTTLTAIALAAALAQPAWATTFSKLTTIYVGSGVSDDGGATLMGVATAFLCSNVSGQNATVRFLVLGRHGTLLASNSATIPHGGTRAAVTHLAAGISSDVNLATGFLGHGTVNIESTQSGVFCNAVVVNAATPAYGYPVRLVRINPHPGAVE
jgi:hypothetical protein